MTVAMDRVKRRSTNFTANEVKILLNVVGKYNKTFIEFRTNRRKNAIIWKDIEKQFNAISEETFRSAVVLKQKYENVKKLCKKKIAEEKQTVYAKRPLPSRNIDNTKFAVTAQKLLFSDDLDEQYDDAITDEIPEQSVELAMWGDEKAQESTSTSKQQDFEFIACPDEIDPNSSKCFQYANRSISTATILNANNGTIDNCQRLAEAKLLLVEQRRRNEKEKHLLQMELAREAHEAKMGMAKEVNDMMIALLKEEIKAVKSKGVF